MIDAPVSGGATTADAGTLTFMVGGSDEAVQRADRVLHAMGKKVFHAGGAGNGQAAKIANNMLLGTSMIATCEAFALAKRLGLDAQTFFDISSNSSGQNWSMTSYCPAPGPVPRAPSNRNYQAGLAVNMMLKDLHLARQAIEQSGSNTVLSEKAARVFESLSEDGFGDKDFSIVMNLVSGDLA